MWDSTAEYSDWVGTQVTHPIMVVTLCYFVLCLAVALDQSDTCMSERKHLFLWELDMGLDMTESEDVFIYESINIIPGGKQSQPKRKAQLHFGQFWGVAFQRVIATSHLLQVSPWLFGLDCIGIKMPVWQMVNAYLQSWCTKDRS